MNVYKVLEQMKQHRISRAWSVMSSVPASVSLR